MSLKKALFESLKSWRVEELVMSKYVRLFKSIALIVGFISLPAHAVNTFITLDNFELWSSTYEADTIRINDLNGEQNPENCTDPDTYFLSTALSLEAQNRAYSTLMAAKLSKQPIQIILSGCQGGRPKVVSVILK
tara:strand:- start:11268 stop:11672 length:405 start_codon:yes stop_codon:yes gene_type:complete